MSLVKQPSFKEMSSPTSALEITISGKNFQKSEDNSRTDFACFVLLYDKNGTWKKVGKTEFKRDSLNPSWHEKIIVDYRFEELQRVKFEVFNENGSYSRELYGEVETTLGKIVAAEGGQFRAKFTEGNKGEIVITAQELPSFKEKVKIKLSARKLFYRGSSSEKTRPYFVVSKIGPENKFTTVYRSDYAYAEDEVSWEPFDIALRDLCNGDYSRLIKIDVFNHRGTKHHQYFGGFHCSLTELEEAVKTKKTFKLFNPTLELEKDYKKSGEVLIDEILITQGKPTFVEAVQEGLKIYFSVAIDFTRSNGEPSDPNSLHHRNGQNHYRMAIESVGKIISDYSIDNIFPSYGFGAKIPPKREASHGFPLTLKEDNPNCIGVEGIMEAYETALEKVVLFGPTNFSPVIENMASIASRCTDGYTYYVLLIITDGIISDFQETIDAIVKASDLPLSIIIVGVGNVDFRKMKVLDADNEPLFDSKNQKAKRDLVQFVELQKFMNEKEQSNKEAELAKEVLREIPDQVLEHLQQAGKDIGIKTRSQVLVKSPKSPTKDNVDLFDKANKYCN